MFFILGLAPYALNFFIGFDVGVDYVETVLTLSSYIGFMLSLSLAFGIAFQLPIVLFFAERLGIVKLEQLKQARKFVFLGLFVAAAALTPPDPITMTSLAIPMYILFEGSMLISSICRKKKKEEVTEEDGN